MNFVSLDDIQLVEPSGFKMKQGDLYRISFALFPGFESGNFDFSKALLLVQGDSLYINGGGRFLDEGGVLSRISGQPSKTYFATVIISWPLGKNREVSNASLLEGNYEVSIMKFTKKRLQEIRRAYDVAGYNLGEVDLLLDCKDEKYQSASYTPLHDSVFRKISSSQKEELQAIHADVTAKIQQQAQNLESTIGRRVTVDEFRAILAKISYKDGGNDSSELVASSLPPSVSAPAGVKTEDIEDLLSDL